MALIGLIELIQLASLKAFLPAISFTLISSCLLLFLHLKLICQARPFYFRRSFPVSRSEIMCCLLSPARDNSDDPRNLCLLGPATLQRGLKGMDAVHSPDRDFRGHDGYIACAIYLVAPFALGNKKETRWSQGKARCSEGDLLRCREVELWFGC